MKPFFTFAGAVLLALLSSGCAALWPYEQARVNLDHSRQLRVGLTKAEVLQIMGEPESSEVYNTPDRWFYYAYPQWHDFLVTEDECLPLIFEDGVLIGWGNDFYSQYLLRRESPQWRQ